MIEAPPPSRPRDLLARLEARAHAGYRYLAAAIGALAVVASLLVGLSRRPPSPS